MTGTYVKLEGIDELTKELKRVLVNHKPDEVRKAMRRSSKVIVDQAKSNAPVSKKPHEFTSAAGETITIQPGMLRKSIQILPKFRGDPAGSYVGPKISRRNAKARINAYYCAWVEHGTAAHNLGYKGKFISAQGSNHPGSKPKPYMRPAYDSAGGRAIKVAMEDIEKMVMNK